MDIIIENTPQKITIATLQNQTDTRPNPEKKLNAYLDSFMERLASPEELRDKKGQLLASRFLV